MGKKMTDTNPFEGWMHAKLDRAGSAATAERAPMPSSPRAIHAGDVALAVREKSVALTDSPAAGLQKSIALTDSPAAEPQKSNRPSDSPAAEPKVPRVPAILQGKAIKATIPLDPARLLDLRIGQGDVRTVLTIDAGGRRVTADLASKSIRKAQATIREHGVDGTFCAIQAKLAAGDVLTEAGLLAQVKAPKP
jgi:hypothetical protein